MKTKIAVLGAGLAGLSAGYKLSQQNIPLLILEKESQIGGLAKTIQFGDFKFDLGPHRFFSDDKEIEKFVRDLLDKEILILKRSTKIFFQKKYFDYPLRFPNLIFNLPFLISFKISSSFLIAKFKNIFLNLAENNFEEWVINRFGKKLYQIYFKPYTEKLWGIPCGQISSDWANQRIKGVSIREILKEMFLNPKDKIRTFQDSFFYSQNGIGLISQKLSSQILRDNKIITNAKITQINHQLNRIISIDYILDNQLFNIEADYYISSIPITDLILLLNPKTPSKIIEINNKLKYRGLVIVALIINRRRITKDTWLYFPERDISFCRITEPKNWSYYLAPDNKTLLLLEYFCSENDKIWQMEDKAIVDLAMKDLTQKLNYLKTKDIIGAKIIKINKAYPVYNLNYNLYLNKIRNYLNNFQNLYLIGRLGNFQYNNMDNAIKDGFEIASKIIKSNVQ